MLNDKPDTWHKKPPLSERMERALLLLAWLIEIDGDAHGPLFERIEAELLVLRHKEGVRVRARHLLESYTRSGASNAICDRTLSFSSSDGPRPYLGL